MIFWTITSRASGRFCGYQRKAKDLWLRRAVFRWSDPIPDPSRDVVFPDENAALKFLRTHPDLPADCEIKYTGPTMSEQQARGSGLT